MCICFFLGRIQVGILREHCHVSLITVAMLLYIAQHSCSVCEAAQVSQRKLLSGCPLSETCIRNSLSDTKTTEALVPQRSSLPLDGRGGELCSRRNGVGGVVGQVVRRALDSVESADCKGGGRWSLAGRASLGSVSCEPPGQSSGAPRFTSDSTHWGCGYLRDCGSKTRGYSQM